MLLTIIAFVFVITLVILAHEFGHLIASKRAGIGVDEFGIGMGPRLFSFKRAETTYGIHLFPVGGFVSLTGVDGETDPSKISAVKNFNLKPIGQRFMSIFAGPLANIILAVVIFFIVFLLIGVPVGLKNQVATVKPGSPADLAGLKAGDIVLALDHQEITSMEKTIDRIHNWPVNQPLTLTLQRAEKKLEIKVIPEYNAKRKMSFIGFAPAVISKKYGFFSALYMSFKQTGEVIFGVFYGFFLLFTGKVGWEGLAGPLGIAQFTGQVAAAGFDALLQFTAFISINLAIVNLLPIPALDGGRLLFLIIEFFRGKPIDAEKEKYFHLVGFVVLIGLLILFTYNDLMRIILKRPFLK